MHKPKPITRTLTRGEIPNDITKSTNYTTYLLYAQNYQSNMDHLSSNVSTKDNVTYPKTILVEDNNEPIENQTKIHDYNKTYNNEDLYEKFLEMEQDKRISRTIFDFKRHLSTQKSMLFKKYMEYCYHDLNFRQEVEKIIGKNFEKMDNQFNNTDIYVVKFPEDPEKMRQIRTLMANKEINDLQKKLEPCFNIGSQTATEAMKSKIKSAFTFTINDFLPLKVHCNCKAPCFCHNVRPPTIWEKGYRKLALYSNRFKYYIQRKSLIRKLKETKD